MKVSPNAWQADPRPAARLGPEPEVEAGAPSRVLPDGPGFPGPGSGRWRRRRWPSRAAVVRSPSAGGAQAEDLSSRRPG